jgi:hypothetical protein
MDFNPQFLKDLNHIKTCLGINLVDKARDKYVYRHEAGRFLFRRQKYQKIAALLQEVINRVLIEGFEGFEGFQGFRVSGLQGCRLQVAGHRAEPRCRVSGFQGFRV